MDSLNYLKKLHNEIIDLTAKLTIDGSFRKDGAVVCYYGTMVELSGALIVLADAQLKTAMSGVFRSLLEAYANFINVSTDISYVHHLEAEHEKKWIRLFNEAKTGNEYLKSLAAVANADAKLKKCESALEALKKRRYGPLYISEKFERAGLQKEYRSVYLLSSGYTHGDLGALLERHLQFEGEEFKLHIYRELGPEDFLVYVDSTAGILLNGTVLLHQRLKSDCQKDLAKLQAELQEIREGYDLPDAA